MFKKPIAHEVTMKLDEETVEQLNATAEVYRKAFTKAGVTVVLSLAATRLLEAYLTSKHSNR